MTSPAANRKFELPRDGIIVALGKHVAMAAALLLAAGCMDMGLWAPGPCISQDDCSEDQRCILGVCTAVPDFEVDVEITPVSTSNHLPYPVRVVDLDSLDALRITVPPTRVVRGQLHLEQKPYQGSARLSFNSEAALRRPLRYTTDLSSQAETAGTFEIRLVGSMLDGGRTEPIPYAVTAWPLETTDCCLDESVACPVPVMMSGLRFRTDTDDLVLAFPDSPTRISGRVIANEETEALPHKMRVQAWSVAGSAYSLPVETDESGNFCLALDLQEKGAAAMVKLRVSPATAGLPAPIVEQELEVLGGQAHRDVELNIGDFGAPLEIRGEILSRQDEPIEGAHVSFTGEVATGGTFFATAFSRADGTFVMNLLPGTYRALAVPPEASSSATIEVTDLVVSPETTGSTSLFFSHRAPDRATLTGSVVGPEKERTPVRELEVIAELECSLQNGASSRLERFTGWTDEEGRFLLNVDPGSYRLYFRASIASGLPWMVGPVVEMEASTPRDLGAVVLEEASVFDGKVLGEVEGGQTVALVGARVEVHARRRERTHLLWEGRADEDGSFQVVLPRSLTSRVETTEPREPDVEDSW